MLAYYELDTVGNVRRLHADPQSPVHGDLGGYSYTAFGKTIAVSDPGGVRPPLDIANQPFQWQGKRLLAAGLYDSRARVWSTDLGAFLQPDEYVYLSRAGTLWSWPGQNPFRWRDPSGRLAGEEWYYVAQELGPYAAPLAADIAALALFADSVNDLGAEIFAQQDANADAIARAAERDRPVSTPDAPGSDPIEDAEHTKNPRPSNLPKHEKGEERRKTDKGGEKADPCRRPARQRPADQPKGPWPPKKN